MGLGALALATGVAAATLPDDPALHKPITLAVKGEALSDVMKLLHDQTGVELKVQNEVADQKVTIFVDGKPLREVMEGLVTVLQYTWSAQTANGHGLYEIGESEQARIGRETEWQKMVAKTWDDLDATLKRRAALTVNAAELQAEMERFRAVAENERNKVWGEREKMMRQRDTPVAAAMSGDLAISRLYCHLSTEAMAALKAGNYVRFDSQSPDPAWKLPADVVEYLAPFVRTEEWVRPELPHRRGESGTNDRTPVWDNYAVTLQASTDPHGVSLGTTVIPRSSAVKEVHRDVQVRQCYRLRPTEIPDSRYPSSPAKDAGQGS